jgi:hypothetical protein
MVPVTPSTPFPYKFLPYTYWEHRAVEQLFTMPDLDPRVHMVFPGHGNRMHDYSVKCFESGLEEADFLLPSKWAAGRPASITPDRAEDEKNYVEELGCYKGDITHHNVNGGWMMADVWWSGIRYYLKL